MAKRIYDLIGKSDGDTNSFYIEKNGRHGVFQDGSIIDSIVDRIHTLFEVNRGVWKYTLDPDF